MYHPSIQGSQGIIPSMQSQPERNFQPGQIVTGKVNKFFPDNRALLQIGAKQVIAELQTSLSAGGTYWFEVKEGGERPRLQVLPQTTGKQADVSQLIELTGHKPSKTNTGFVDGLIKQQTPFTMPQLKQALDLLQQSPQSLEARKEALQLIMNRQLPLTENVLQAITARQTQDLTASLHQLTDSIAPQSRQAMPLQQALGILSPDGPAVNERQLIQQIFQEAKTGKQELYQAIRPYFTGDAPPFDAWQKQWNALEGNLSEAGVAQAHSVQAQGVLSAKTAGTIPFSQALDAFITELQTVGSHSVSAQERLQTALSTIRQLLSMFPDRTLPDEAEATLRASSDGFQSMAGVQELYSLLKRGTTDNEQLLVKSSELLQLLSTAQRNEQSKDGEFFKQLMQEVFRQTGFSYESDLAAADAEDLPLKGLLLQHAAQSADKAELSNQLLQQITGSQLLQVQDDKQMAYIQLQLPGAPFGFDKDILMELEGRKEDSGQLSADHCRILFYLHLPHLSDIAVDMYVQKKTVNLHIYASAEQAEQVMRPLQDKLKSALDLNGYHLSTVKYTVSNKANDKNRVSTDWSAGYHDQKGVDFRI